MKNKINIMKDINNFIIEGAVGRDIKNVDQDVYRLIIKLLVMFTKGDIDIYDKDNKELIKDVKRLIWDMS